MGEQTCPSLATRRTPPTRQIPPTPPWSPRMTQPSTDLDPSQAPSLTDLFVSGSTFRCRAVHTKGTAVKEQKLKSKYETAKNGHAMAKHEPSPNPLRPAHACSTSAHDWSTSPASFTTLTTTAAAMMAEATAMMPNRDRARAQAQAHQWSASSTSLHSHACAHTVEHPH